MALNADFLQERINQLECMVKGMIQTNRNMMLTQNQHLPDAVGMSNGLMNGAQPDQMVAKERTIQENTELLGEGVMIDGATSQPPIISLGNGIQATVLETFDIPKQQSDPLVADEVAKVSEPQSVTVTGGGVASTSKETEESESEKRKRKIESDEGRELKKKMKMKNCERHQMKNGIPEL